ncbi:MAG TPA: hypothetical protein VMR76_00990 [Candidatus Saccharimonadia bacterium]|nr:hypothetical protein [Candidatus Saccharimonadia bacterium]
MRKKKFNYNLKRIKEKQDYLNRIEIYQDDKKPEIFWILDPEQFKLPLDIP